jgi:hypothetical protein
MKLCRNLAVYQLWRSGLWSLRQLADAVELPHSRVWAIVRAMEAARESTGDESERAENAPAAVVLGRLARSGGRKSEHRSGA